MGIDGSDLGNEVDGRYERRPGKWNILRRLTEDNLLRDRRAGIFVAAVTAGRGNRADKVEDRRHSGIEIHDRHTSAMVDLGRAHTVKFQKTVADAVGTVRASHASHSEPFALYM